MDTTEPSQVFLTQSRRQRMPDTKSRTMYARREVEGCTIEWEKETRSGAPLSMLEAWLDVSTVDLNIRYRTYIGASQLLP